MSNIFEGCGELRFEKIELPDCELPELPVEQLSKLDQERDIFIGYDYPHDVQEPDFRTFKEDDILGYFMDKEDRIKVGDYIHFAE